MQHAYQATYDGTIADPECRTCGEYEGAGDHYERQSV